MVEFRSVHKLEILLILRVGALRHFVEPLAEVPVARSPKLREGIEKMIVGCHASRRNEAAHREGVHQRIEEALVLVSLRRWESALSAVCITRILFGCSLRLGKRERGQIDAEMVFRGGANPGLRIDGPAQVVVQVRAFRHVLEKIEELQRSEERRVGRECRSRWSPY